MNTPEATFLGQMSWKYVCKFILMNSRSSLNVGHVGSKTRSQDVYRENPCEHYRDYIFGLNMLEIYMQGDFDDF